jgi:hypothetical protein
MEAWRVIEGELRSMGIHGLSNKGIMHQYNCLQPNAPPPVAISLYIRYIYRLIHVSRLSGYTII